MGRPLSVGARWSLRYAVALFVTVSLLGVFVYDRVERRILQDAELLLEHQMKEIDKGLRSYEGEELDRFLHEKIEVGEHMIGLGIAIHDAAGRRIRGVGSLESTTPPPPQALLDGEEFEMFYEAELARSYPFFLMAQRLPDGYLQVAIYGRPYVRRVEHIADVFFYATPVVLLLTALVGFWLARASLRPIAEITSTARDISGSQLERQVPTRGTGDELDQLAETLNDMLGRIRGGMERMRRFSVQASRELHGPLVRLQRQFARLRGADGLPEWLRRELRSAEEEADALAESVQAMLRLAWSGGEARDVVAVPMQRVLESVLEGEQEEARGAGVELRVGVLPEVDVCGDPFRLHQLFSSLVRASLRSTSGGGWVSVEAELTEAALRVALRRSDPKEDALPGPTLAVARDILRDHGGTLEVGEAPESRGTTVLTLPLA